MWICLYEYILITSHWFPLHFCCSLFGHLTFWRLNTRPEDFRLFEYKQLEFEIELHGSFQNFNKKVSLFLKSCFNICILIFCNEQSMNKWWVVNEIMNTEKIKRLLVCLFYISSGACQDESWPKTDSFLNVKIWEKRNCLLYYTR